MNSTPEQSADHNSTQIRYYQRTNLPRMVPIASPYLLRHVDEMIRFGRLESDQRILEVGCGMGRYTLLLAERGFRIEGLDLIPKLLESLKESAAGRYDIPLYCADVASPAPELLEQFDALLVTFALHHMHDLSKCVSGMARMLKPGGRMVFLEPNAFNILYYIQIAVSPGITWEGDKGVMNMRRGPVFEAMRTAGLTELKLERFGFFPPFLTNRRLGQRLESVLERFPLWRWALPFQLFGGTRG